MKNSILYIILLIFNHLAQAQNLQFEWLGERNNPEHTAKAIAAMPDGGAILVGKNSPSPDRRFDALLVKVDSLGDKIWQKNYGSDDSEEALDVLVLPDGSIVFCGYVESATEQRSVGFVRKVDAAGAEVWYFELKNFSFERITKISLATDGGVLFGGQYFKDNNWFIFYGKLDAAGQKIYFDQPWNSYGTLIRIRESPADGLPILIRNTFGTSTFDVVKYNVNGFFNTHIWKHTVNVYNLDWIKKADLLPTADGGAWFAYPNSYSQLEVRVLDASGGLARADTLDFAKFYDLKIFKQADGRREIMAAATENSMAKMFRIVWSENDGFEQVDPLGESWQRFFGLPLDATARFSGQRFWVVYGNFTITALDLESSAIEPVWSKYPFSIPFLNQFPHEYLLKNIRTATGGSMALSAPAPNEPYFLLSHNLSLWLVDKTGKAVGKNLEFYKTQNTWLYVVSFEPMPDGGAAVLLLEQKFDSQQQQPILVRCDAAGKVLFSKKLDLPEPPYALEKLIVRPDGRFAIPIVKSSGSTEKKTIYLFDADGNWTGLRRIGKTTDDIASVIAAPDGSLVAFGTTEFDASNGSSFLMLRTDGLGGEAQRVETEPKLSDLRFWASQQGKLVPTSDGGFVGIGANGFNFNGIFAVVKFDKNGRAEWSAPVTVANYWRSFSISEVAGRGFVVEQFAAEYMSEGVAAFFEKNTQIVLHFIDNQGVVSEPNVISLYPKVEQSNPYFLENYTWQGWGDALHLATRDLIFLRAETYRNPNKLPVAAELQIAPNPSSGELSFQFASQFLGEVEVEIFSEIGQRVLRSVSPKISEVFRFGEFEDRFSAGVYFVRVRAGGEVFCGRWVKI